MERVEVFRFEDESASKIQIAINNWLKKKGDKINITQRLSSLTTARVFAHRQEVPIKNKNDPPSR